MKNTQLELLPATSPALVELTAPELETLARTVKAEGKFIARLDLVACGKYLALVCPLPPGERQVT